MSKKIKGVLEEMSDVEMELEQVIDLTSMYTHPQTPIVKKWMNSFNEGTLTSSDFRDYWRVWVPKHAMNMPMHWSGKEEDQPQDDLISTLEEFICNGDKDVIFNMLSESDNPSAVCGKVFKMGEPTYNCKECGMDATCVLCVDCFKQSIHKTHKYKMGTSGGGGCCDCGDVEAWKIGPCCDKHKVIKPLIPSGSGNVRYRFPRDLVERTELLFNCILSYAYQVLTLEWLPNDLRIKGTEQDNPIAMFEADQYCTVMYNDETHTFEQVINTLARVIKCSQRDAIEFVTNIDREGRTVVKSSTFQHCSELKSDIEKFTSRHGGTRPLKVLVVHAFVIAHQNFALRLLTWLQKLCSYAEGFRNAFTIVILKENNEEPAIIERILQRDSLLWKSARLHWHRLFIAGMFMEYRNKKYFAKFFTKFYGNIMKDFIRDDHDHSFSVASLSIQIFTVPTLAHYLIAREDAMLILMNTFISECYRKCNKLGKLEFDRSTPNGPFKRATYILYDLRYLLGVPPEVWTDDLRRGFLQSISLVLTLLTYMQGMDSVTRQVGQHMEYEPEWESAFNLHLKLAPVITLLLKWCATDRVVLIKAYRLTLTRLYENASYDKSQQGEVRELADHSASCLQYDVATQPVSIHLPLSRFLAGLHLHLEKFNLSFDSQEFVSVTKQTPEQILEPVLRTQVMIAQVHAGMWRRNGYSLANQIYFYHNVKCRGEMLDKDIVLLQMCASLIESNEFLIHLLNKFALINWASQDFDKNTARSSEEEGMKQTINLVEEFLSLLIVIIGERYVPGVGMVTQDECIKNEIIHQLFIRPLSHSEVNKALPDDLNQETGMERVINEVATFKKPSQNSGKGVYEIKREYLDRYNVFFYHYTKEELSRSEEEQRKLRKSITGLECCPPPVLPALTEPFSMVANLLQCDVMLYLMRTVLERSLNLRSRSFSEAQLQKILHLIGYALHEEEQKYYSFFTFTKRARKWDLEAMLEELCNSSRVEVYKHLLKWTVNKFKQLSSPSIVQNVDLIEPCNSKLSEVQEKQYRARLAAEKRAAIMAQMLKMQQNFMKDNADLFEKTVVSTAEKMEPQEVPQVAKSSNDGTPIALGPNQSPKVSEGRKFTCILCQEDQEISRNGPAMVLAAFVQKSTVLCRNRNVFGASDDKKLPLILNSNMGPAPHTGTCGHVMHSTCWKKYIQTIHSKENRRPYRLRQPTSFDIEKNEYLCPLCECLNNTVLPIVPMLNTLPNGKPLTQAHKLTFANWYEASIIAITHKQKADMSIKGNLLAKFEDGLKSMDTEFKDSSTVAVSGSGSQDIETVVIHSDSDETDDDMDDDTLEPANQLISTSPNSYPSLNAIVPLTESDVYLQLRVFSKWSDGVDKDIGDGEESGASCGLSEDLLEMINIFSLIAYTKGLDVDPHENDTAIPMMAWKTCAYTIHSIEWLLRYTEKPLLGDFTCRQQDGLENLIRLAGVLGTAWKERQAINRHGVQLLTMIIGTPGTYSCDPSILDWDCFGVLVPLTSTFPSIFHCDPVPVPSGSQLELHSFYLMFLAQFAQIIISLEMNDGADEEKEVDIVSKETQCLAQIVRIFRDIPSVNTDEVWKVLKSSSLSYLRCCAIYYHFLTGVPAPPALKKVGGDTFENLCAYLGIPSTCNELMNHSYVLKLYNNWASHRKIVSLRSHNDAILNMVPLNELVRLPDDYSELINTVSLFTCPNSDREDSRNPTMCLVCGEVLCSQTYCCQTELDKVLVGACTYHAHACGAGAGIFLRIRECEILFLATPNRGCFRAPPYVDDYGEVDQGLRRGNPLHLCKESYHKLQLMWLSHSIHEEIARAIELSHTLMPTQWQHL
ncbi:E3 ubiquitin-protein ligase UBR2 [Cimex lectularius]|uniref:E3 ubiquitin-protein ligase n=1 Tax=Cimex lectularius TaxID=79782 RepID=A0A8I6RSB6_CIMLE|nr:E3 ubiquitin-protein ligase UBR2 [Cimex lectularius]XP_014250465.1 E3 ubiquitin-protein ligase UBR2 [Cimex lectularius]